MGVERSVIVEHLLDTTESIPVADGHKWKNMENLERTYMNKSQREDVHKDYITHPLGWTP